MVALTDAQRRAMFARKPVSLPLIRNFGPVTTPSLNAELKAEIKRNRRLTLFKDSEPHQLNFFADKIKQGGTVQFVSGGPVFGGKKVGDDIIEVESFQLGTPVSERQKIRIQKAIIQLRVDNVKQERKMLLEDQKRAEGFSK